MANAEQVEPVLSVRDLGVTFDGPPHDVYAVNGVSWDLYPGEWLGLVGESGSGKTASLWAVMGLLRQTATVRGSVRLLGEDLLTLAPRDWAAVRGRDIAMVFQGLSTALNPYLGVGPQVMEPLLEHRLATRAEARERAIGLLEELGIADAAARFASRPYEWSGGMQQRAGIAAALIADPAVLLADEPTTALDATVQLQVLAVLQAACTRRGMAVVLVTHDFGVAAQMCDRIAVMYGGRIMETALVAAFTEAPRHPYTQALQAAIIDPEDPWQPLRPIPGAGASLTLPLTGCPFAPRCPWVADVCRTVVPPLLPVAPAHAVACHRVVEVGRHG